jgi:hypothetical protein
VRFLVRLPRLHQISRLVLLMQKNRQRKLQKLLRSPQEKYLIRRHPRLTALLRLMQRTRTALRLDRHGRSS